MNTQERMREIEKDISKNSCLVADAHFLFEALKVALIELENVRRNAFKVSIQIEHAEDALTRIDALAQRGEGGSE